MTTHQKILATLTSTFFLLGGCASPDGVAGASSGLEEQPQLCEPELVLPLRLVADGYDQVGDATVTTVGDDVLVSVTVGEGWELGDMYVAAGPDPSTLTYYATNTEWWVTGWFDTLEIRIPIHEVGVGCDSDFKLMVQAYVRAGGDTSTRQLSSAFGRFGGDPWGWWDYYAMCCPDAGCTYTQGYWKNYRRHEWPVDSLTLGDRVYDQPELLGLLRTPVRGDISVALAHQLIAAQLNFENGASSISAIGDAQDWMSAHGDGGPLPYGISPSSPEGAQAEALNDALDRYNQGITGPGHCDD
jgi:hypothetical protein